MNLPGWDDIKQFDQKQWTTKNEVLDIIFHHKLANVMEIEGPTHITNKRIRIALFKLLKIKLTGIQIRDIVKIARRCTAPIGSSSKGYFWAIHPNELNDTISSLEGRAASIAVTKHGVVAARTKLMELQVEMRI